MPQPPSFPFYPGDWIAGTATLSLEAKGAYIDCLAHQWGADEGVPGDDPVALSRIIRGSKSDAKRLWLALAPKFEKQSDGTYRNSRLEREREAKARYYEAKRRNGEKGGRPRLSENVAQVITETKPTGYPPSPSPSVPKEQEDARAPEVSMPAAARRRSYADPHGFRLDPNAAAHIVVGEGQVVSVPAQWATKACREYSLTSADLDAFAKWAAAAVRAEGGFDDGGKRFPWLDGMLARWRAERRTASDASAEIARTKAMLAEMDQHGANRGPAEDVVKALRAGYGR